MQVRYNASIRSQHSSHKAASLFGAAIFLPAVLVLLWINMGFARYALTGFLWTRTDGTVLTGPDPFVPTIQFSTPGGAVRTFSEDYMVLCGGNVHSFCLLRSFTPGQVIPIVYDPAVPGRAFVHDWALISSVITWLLEAALCLLSAFGIAVMLRRKPPNIAARLGTPIKARGPFR